MDLGLSCIEWLWFPQESHLLLVTRVFFYASQGPSDSVPHLGLHGPSDSGPNPGIMGSGYSIPHLGLTLTTDHWSHSGPQTKLVFWFPFWVSPLPGKSGHAWASLGPGESGP